MLKKFTALCLLFSLLLGSYVSAQAGNNVRIRNRTENLRSRGSALCFEKDNSYAKWKQKGDSLSISFNIENLDSSAAIDAFDIEIYCEDVYENIIYPSGCSDDNGILTYTIKKTIKPGKTAYSSYCRISDCPGIGYVYAAISKYHYKKGSEPTNSYSSPDETNTVEISESSLEWHTWTID